jgi:hypothetical protein
MQARHGVLSEETLQSRPCIYSRSLGLWTSRRPGSNGNDRITRRTNTATHVRMLTGLFIVRDQAPELHLGAQGMHTCGTERGLEARLQLRGCNPRGRSILFFL